MSSNTRRPPLRSSTAAESIRDVERGKRDVAKHFRRSPHIVSYWADGRLVFHNFATGIRATGTALTIGLLDYFHTWRPVVPLVERSTLPRATLRAALRKLVSCSLLQESGRRLHPIERAMEQWANWNPAAGFFHFSTKDLPFAEGEAHALEFLSNKLATHPVPPLTKTYRRRPSVALPALASPDSFSRILLARRTWRKFGHQPLPLAALSTLMNLTFGAQRFMDLGAAGSAMLRTSPSAGARNPLEAYVVVRHVSGVSPGIYHYAPVEHRLVRIRDGSRSTIERHLPGQSWYGQASLLVLITAIFARTEWKYPSARAYRDVLLEAGHFCQTFCLVATALGLAPFCTAALADSVIERDLGLDGVTESIVYACGVGPRPVGVEWAPWPPETRRRPLNASAASSRGGGRRR
jgi:SagB-type dehydrogenase family enzyme